LNEKIEILPVQLLDSEKLRVTELKDLARRLNLEFGWHYLLDLVWILGGLDTGADQRIMDAGAGIGVMQWYLAEQGVQVVSVDRDSRAYLPARFRRMFRVEGLRSEDLSPLGQKPVSDRKDLTRSARSAIKRIKESSENLFTRSSKHNKPGSVLIYNKDLKDLSDIPDNLLDAVVAVSSLEHNSADDLRLVVMELMRVLKPGSPLLATLGAAKDVDWFHEPSKGWCYSEQSLRRAFDFSEDVPSNYEDYDELMQELKNCQSLRENLASFYFRSGDNGMPWGVWDPQYQPVGVCKIKQHG
jgi:SAM-dependent methyltransferase